MPMYSIKWEIDIDAKTPRAAAEQAYRIQRDPTSFKPVLEVCSRRGKITLIDLENDNDD